MSKYHIKLQVQVATEELTLAGPVVVRLFNFLFSVSLSSPLTQHPSAVGPTFFLLRLALRHAELVGAQERRLYQVHHPYAWSPGTPCDGSRAPFCVLLCKVGDVMRHGISSIIGP